MTTQSDPIYRLADTAGLAQARFQQDFKDVDPVVGIMRSLRDSGFAADAMTIDCMRSGKRIICIMHDDNPGVVDYQFGDRDKDPDMNFLKISKSELTQVQFYDWMKKYFIETSQT